MDPIDTSQHYDSYYFSHCCGQPYQRDEQWLDFFGNIAEQIANMIAPSCVLDAGCAMGFLVEALRNRSVEAYGIDISAYAIQNVHPQIRTYCHVASVLDPFLRTYDLIVCIEVLEHLPRAQGEEAIANFCQYTDDILFSSSPFDYKEITHENVQPPEYWAKQFALHGFYRDVDFDASFVTPWAVRFRRTSDTPAHIIAGYERRFWQLLQENQARRELNFDLATTIRRLEVLQEHATQQDEALRALNGRILELETQRAQLEATLGGRFLRQMQRFRAWVSPPNSRRDQVLDRYLQRFVFGNRDEQQSKD